MKSLILLIATLFIGLSFGGPNKMITKTGTWEGGYKCTVKIDTSTTNRVKWNFNGNISYRYPLVAKCTGSGELTSIELYDKEDFLIGDDTFCFRGYSSSEAYCVYQVHTSPDRIYDALRIEMRARVQ